MTNTSVSIRAHNLVVRYSDLVALAIPRLECSGRVIALLGQNGAGKSTLLKTILGLLEPLSGQVSFTKGDGSILKPERDMAFCPENGAIFADISVERYLECWCRITRNDARYYRNAGSKYVELLSIEELLTKKGRELSKGQRRRVQTALGFMGDPSLFLFDASYFAFQIAQSAASACPLAASSFSAASVDSSMIGSCSAALASLARCCAISRTAIAIDLSMSPSSWKTKVK